MYTYQWYKGRKKIEGATEKTLEVTKDGEYTVDVVAHDGKNESAAATSNSITLAFEKHDVMLAFAHGEVERHANEIGGTFTNGLTIQVCALGAVVYTSDNEDVATVDPATGEVAIKGVGEAVITAKIAETDTHEAAEASYKLTVTDHDSGTWQTVKEPTRTEAGSEQRVCEVCGEVLETREISAKGHKDGEWVVTKQATCTEPGEKELHCATCGELFLDAEGEQPADEDALAIPALGHKLEQVVAVAPTIDKEGVEAHYRCTVCGELYWDAEGTKKVEHADDLVVEKLEAVTVTFDDCIDPKDDQVSVRLEKGGVISPDDIPPIPATRATRSWVGSCSMRRRRSGAISSIRRRRCRTTCSWAPSGRRTTGPTAVRRKSLPISPVRPRRSPLPSPMMRARRRWSRRVTARSRRWPPPLRRASPRFSLAWASIAAERTRRDFSLRRVAESRSSQEVSEAHPRKERVPLVARGRRSSSLEGAGAACLRKRRRALREAGGA